VHIAPFNRLLDHLKSRTDCRLHQALFSYYESLFHNIVLNDSEEYKNNQRKQAKKVCNSDDVSLVLGHNIKNTMKYLTRYVFYLL